MDAARIKSLRSSLGLTQASLAQALGVTATTISQWETGRASPAPAQVSKLSTLAAKAPVGSSAKAFRPIQYLGSKMRIAQPIADLVSELNRSGGRVGDIFSGSGVVSGVLSRYQPVTAVDVQRYAAVLADGLLNGTADELDTLESPKFWALYAEAYERFAAIFKDLLAYEADALHSAAAGRSQSLVALIDWGSLAAHRQRGQLNGTGRLGQAAQAALSALSASSVPEDQVTAALFFGGGYFSIQQGLELDALYLSANALGASVGKAVLLSVASDIVNTVGKQFAQPIRIQKSDGSIQPLLFSRAQRDRNLSAADRWPVWLSRWRSELTQRRYCGDARCQDVFDFIASDNDCAIYYADPPYTIDHYSRFYHVLETLIERDSPTLDSMLKNGGQQVMRGLYRVNRHQSPFCVPSTVEDAFDRLFEGSANGGRTLILSYSAFDSAAGHRPRMLSLERLVSMAKPRFRRVEALPALSHTHRKLNAKENNVKSSASAESFIVCEV